MGAIRLAPRDTSFETPAQFDPGAFDFYSTMAYDSLYQSPVSALYRGGTMAYQKNFGSENILDPEIAQEKYGLEGMLNFQEPIRESAAKLMMDRKVAEVRREQLLSGGFRHGGVGRGVTGFGVSLGASLLDPINLASMFIPVAGPTSRLTQAGMSVRKARLLTGAIEGAVGQAIVEPLVLFPNIYEQSNYGWEESVTNIAAGTVLGSGLHFGLGEIGDKFKQISEAFNPNFDLWKSPVDGRPLDRTEWAGIEEETHQGIIQTTLAQITQDEPVTAASELIDLDRKVVLDQLRNDIAERSRPEIQEYYLRQSREGYELLVDQLKNKGSKLGWDAERVRAEVEKDLGPDFESKVRRELTGTEEPAEFVKDVQVKQIEEFENKFLDLFELRKLERAKIELNPVDLSLEFSNLKEKYLDFVFEEAHEEGFLGGDKEESLEMFNEFRASLDKTESVPRYKNTDHPFEKISEDPEALNDFTNVYNEALRSGYNLSEAKVTVLDDTVKFEGENYEIILTGNNEASSSYRLLSRKNSIGIYVKDNVKAKDLINTVGLDFEHPVQQLQTKKGKANFTRLYKEALGRGYNLQDAELRMGQESLVFLTKNRAIKFSSEDLSHNEIPGLTTVSEFKMKRGDLYMSVSERVKELGEVSNKEFNMLEKAFEEAGEQLGVMIEDAIPRNMGINSKGELVLLDTGAMSRTEPNTNFRPTNKAVQLLNQVKANKSFNPVVDDAAVKAEIQKRTKNLIAKKRRQYKAEQNKLDQEPPIPQARESVLLTTPIKKSADPVEPLTTKKLEEANAELVVNDFGTQDLSDLFTEGLTFEEARFVQEQTQYLEHVSKMKKALENGIKCISSKQV